MTSDSLILWVRNAVALFEQIVVQANREVLFLEKGESAKGEIKESVPRYIRRQHDMWRLRATDS